MRCLALAQAWAAQGWPVCFACAALPEALADRLKTEGFPVRRLSAAPGGPEDLATTVEAARTAGATHAAIDGYHFGPEFAPALREAGLKVLEADDCAPSRPFTPDWLLNQNPHAAADRYPLRGEATRLLLGTRYALLRREFWRFRGTERKVRERAGRVLVTLGGGDAGGLTVSVIEALSTAAGDRLEVTIVAGPAGAPEEPLRVSVARLGACARIVHSPPNMADLMEWADLAVTAAGSTVWESALAGLPSVVLVIADNQEEVARSVASAGMAVNLGRAAAVDGFQLASTVRTLLDDPDARAAMAAAGRKMIDGHGQDRVAAEMAGVPVWLRPARIDDCEWIWKQANDPGTRANSFSTDPIPWETHQRWYADRLRDSDCLLRVAFDREDRPAGYLRLDLQGREATISVCVASERRGEGLGRPMIEAAARWLFAGRPAELIHAYIRPENLPSIKVFSAAGFRSAGTAVVKGIEALHFTLSRANGG
jgi:UDP-2,4-diacetamido-2,4,6-trideoxy-beta-L-altropyranose hydrolase